MLLFGHNGVLDINCNQWSRL